MDHQGSQNTGDAGARAGADALSSSSQRTSPSHPPPVRNNNNQNYNIHQRIRQHQGHHAGGGGGAGGRMNPSIRQSWLFPTHRASPSTAQPEATSVMTVHMNHHTQNARTDASSSISSTSAAGASTTGSTIIHHRHNAKRIINGSARSRLTKIDRLSKMMLTPNASAPNLVDGTSAFINPASPRRPRLLQTADTPSLASPMSVQSQPSEEDAGGAAVDPPRTSVSVTSTPTNASNAASYPRHIIMRGSSPHRTIEDHLEMDPPSDAFSSSLPSTSAFPPGIEISNHGSGSSSRKTEKANRHTSMPLPKPGWRLYDVPNVEEPNAEQQEPGEGSGAGFRPDGEDRSSFQYSASNASSTTNLDSHHHPYLHQHPVAHSRQESNSTYYTMTPNASNLDLSLASSSHSNLSATLDPSAMSTSDLNIASQSNAQGSNGSGSLPPVPKAIKNSKSPLALRRSSTTSSSSSSSPSNTYLSKGSFPKSSLSAIQQHESKTLTQERQKIVLEILRTERSYVDGLVVLQSLFYEPLNAPYAAGGNSGMNTTTSLYSNLGGQPHQHHHQHNHQHTNNTKHLNTNTGGAGGPGGPQNSSTIPASASSQYPSSTVGSNSTLSAAAAPLLTKKSVSEIFSNFSEIIQVNTLLLTQLETRICGATFSTGWESDEDEDVDIGVIKEESSNAGEENEENGQSQRQGPSLLEEQQQQQQPTEPKPKQVLVTVKSQGGEKEQLLVLDADWCIGDIFIEIAPFLKMYSNYVKTYTSALTHINECMSRNDRFAEFIKITTKRPECKNLDFQSYLMLPVQRIPRYRMLLESLLRHTPEDHPDHRKLQSAFKSMEHTANFVNETIRQHEMFGEMVDLQSKITGLAEPLVAPGRALLKRGNVWKVCRRNVQLRVIILLSDCILWTSPSMNPLDDTLTFHRKVGLENCTVIGAEDPDPTKNAFQIISPEKSSQVYVDTPKEKEAWMVAIRKATQEYLSAKRTLKISITPMQSISHFGASFLRRETGMWSPTALRFGFESRSNTFANNLCVDPELESNSAVAARTSLDGWLHNASGTNLGAGQQQQQQQQQQPLRVVENYNAPVWLPDHSATSCMLCDEEFGTIFRRKHHCRVCGKVVCHSCSTRTVLIQGTHSEKVGRACDQCIGTMFPEDLNVISPVSTNTASTEPSPVEQHLQRPRQGLRPSDPDRRASSQSLDVVMIRPEDYFQEPAAVSNAGATGMVRGLVEAGLNRMKSRSTQLLRAEVNRGNSIAGLGGDSQPKENVRGSNRKADSHGVTSSLTENQTVAQVKACGLCKAEFSMFKWRNICSQCRRVVCSDCLTKKQIDQLFFLGLEAECEASARPVAPADDTTTSTANPQGDDGVVAELALAPPEEPQLWLDPQDMTRPGLHQSISDSAVVADKPVESLLAPPLQGQQRSQSFKVEGSSSSSQSGYGSFGSGWRGMKANNTDSGHGQIEKLCDPCYLGLSLDQVKVLETGGGWQYYQATLSKNQTQEIAAALAVVGDLSLEGNDGDDKEEEDRVDDGGHEHHADQEKKALRMLPDSIQESSAQVV
ncbi:hypothetical protein BGZ68_000925 [Mortierella alpina]|nr:hypothetical protein BGZ68_000925 [Mortierella alpina]